MKKIEYKRCPRCELNYIKKGEKLCSVCQAELDTKNRYVSDLDLELCPICKTNYIQPGEIMCDTCLKEHQNEEGELSADWEQYINRDEEDDYSEEDEQLGEMASITDENDDILSSGYDGDLDDFGDDSDLDDIGDDLQEDEDFDEEDEDFDEDEDDDEDNEDDDDDEDDD